MIPYDENAPMAKESQLSLEAEAAAIKAYAERLAAGHASERRRSGLPTDEVEEIDG